MVKCKALSARITFLYPFDSLNTDKAQGTKLATRDGIEISENVLTAKYWKDHLEDTKTTQTRYA